MIDHYRTLLRPAQASLGRLICLKLTAVAAFILVSNFGVAHRAQFFIGQGYWLKLAIFAAIWALCVAAVVLAALLPGRLPRLAWALALSVSAAIGWGFHHASTAQLTIYDLVGFWEARHEAGRAAAAYGAHIFSAVLLAAAGLFIIAAPPGRTPFANRLWSITPAVPIAAIAGLVMLRGGSATDALPTQFSTLAMTAVVAETIATEDIGERESVPWTPVKGQGPKHIVVIVDESVRADYIDKRAGNPNTPEIAALGGTLIDFGPAVSGGNCSNYANVLLRHAASRLDLIGTARRNASLFAFAKAAGYRTVYIDAQAQQMKDPGNRQNFMTPVEQAAIDRFAPILDAALPDADFRLLDIVAEELKSDAPVFIYANKNGAHIPYDSDYRREEAPFGPTMTEAGEDTWSTKVASYRNAVWWGTDRFLGAFFKRADVNRGDLLMIYTSDHAQRLDPGAVTHCVVENPDPRTGLVPLMAYASDPVLRARLQSGAAANLHRASHFQIGPTVLSLMGYQPKDLAGRYDENLFDTTRHAPAFTSGDVFGLFSDEANWNAIDLAKDYLEPAAKAAIVTGSLP